MDTWKRSPSWFFKEIVWAIDHGGWAVFWSSMSLELSFCSPVCRMFPGLNYRALTLTRPWVIICPFQCFLLPSGLHRVLSSYGSSQPLPPGIWLWITLEKVDIIAPSPENLWSIVVTIRDSALQCRFHGFSVKHCKVTVHFSKISALHQSFWLHLTYNTIVGEFMNISVIERKGKLTCRNNILLGKASDLGFPSPCLGFFVFLNPTLNSNF